MLATNSCRLVSCCYTHSHSHSAGLISKSKTHHVTLAKKKDFSETTIKPRAPLLPLKSPTSSIIQSAGVAVFALGFIDAGYSGDWSRIGVISRETEDLLKAAAFLVAPLSIFVVFKLFRKYSS